MLATRRSTSPAAQEVGSTFATEITAARIFTALEPIHRLPSDDVELLRRAAAGLRFIRSTGTYSDLEHRLFSIALSDVGTADAFVVESAACYAADFVALGDSAIPMPGRSGIQRRALWLAAILRLADALGHVSEPAPEAVYAAWTDEAVYLEFDGEDVQVRQIERARTRGAALEALAGRTVYISGSNARRGAA